MQDIVSLKKPSQIHLTLQATCLKCNHLPRPLLPPVQHARRKVPIGCGEAIKKLLQDMVDQLIITPVSEPAEWVSSLTYPQKPGGSLCKCLDPRHLNKAIIQEHYKAATLDEISHKLSRAKVFSKLDVKDGFCSIYLDTQSSYLTTFNTHKGCYQFLHMPFSLKCHKMYFRCGWTRSPIGFLESLPYIDDIYVYAKDTAEHDRNLLQLK